MKIIIGRIVSDAKKTLIVEVAWKVNHPLYKKTIARRERYLVDAGDQNVVRGDIVQLRETRPISRHKHFVIHKIIKAVKKEEEGNGTA
ncbi:MAG: 30S ribosomal protein S17 [Candidatus Levybacteria bacterium]|nr:30S ribosomal protein S17 [Candidatus Levybacteria bacterium]